MKNPDLNTKRRVLLFSGVAVAALFATPLVPAALGDGLTTFGSAFARHGADDGPNDDGHHGGNDDSGHHGGHHGSNDDGEDAGDDHPGHHHGGDHHGPNHT